MDNLQAKQFITNARAKGIPDGEIMTYLQNKGVDLNPKQQSNGFTKNEKGIFKKEGTLSPGAQFPSPFSKEGVSNIKQSIGLNDSMIQKYQEEEERNLAQKAAGFVLDPLVKLGTETGQAIGKAGLQAADYLSGGAVGRATPEGNLKDALARSTSMESTVPVLGTEVKALKDVTARDVAGQILETGAMLAPTGKLATTVGGKILSATGAKLTPLVVKSSELAGKAIAGAGTGYAMEVGQGLQNEDKTLGEAVQPGITSIAGGLLPVAGVGVKSLADNLPSWFTKNVLPKMTEKAGSVDDVLKKLDYGSVNTNLTKSSNNVSKMGKNIDTILQKPEYSSTKIGKDVLESTVNSFPDSNYTVSHVSNELKKLIPSKGKIIDKFIKGEATFLEANNLKKELYSRTANVFNNVGIPPARKEIGAAFATSIANSIKSGVKETEPIFKELSKEIDLRNALIASSKKAQSKAKLGLYDIAGYFAGGLPAVIGERVATSPGVQLSTAKAVNAVNALSKVKAIPRVAEGAKRAVVKGLSTLNN